MHRDDLISIGALARRTGVAVSAIRYYEDRKLLTRTKQKLDQCIGCGCLSLSRCQLYNKDDRAAVSGTGPRFVLE